MYQKLSLGNEPFGFSVLKPSACDFTWKEGTQKHFLWEHWWEVMLSMSPVTLVIKNLAVNAGEARDTGLIPELGRSPWRKAWQPTPVFFPGASLRRRRLVGYSPVHRGLQRVGHDWINLARMHLLSMGREVGSGGHHMGAWRDAVHYSLPVGLSASAFCLPRWHSNGWASSFLLHLQEITQGLKRYLPAEMTHDELVFAPSYLSSSPGPWIHYVLNLRIWKGVWSFCVLAFSKKSSPGDLYNSTSW